MANTASKLRQRAQNIWPGASVVARGRSTIVHANPTDPGRLMLDAVIGPLHIEGSETEIDTTWVASIDPAWQYQMVMADYHAYARNVLNAGDTIKYVHPSSNHNLIIQPLSLNWVNQDNSRQQISTAGSVQASVTDNFLNWENGYGTGRHLSWKTSPGHLVKTLKIDSLADLPSATVTGTVWLEFEFIFKHSDGLTVWLDGTQWAKTNGVRIQTANRIEFRNETNSPVWWLDIPRAFGSGSGESNETIGQYEVRRQGPNYYITVRVPKTWVDNAVFPIFIDPTITPSVGASGDDCYWRGDGTAYTSTTVYLTIGRTTGTRTFHAYMRFTGISIAAGSTINAAYITLRSQGGSGTVSNIRGAIRGDDQDSPSSAPTSASDGIGRTRTTAKVDWDPSAWTSGSDYNSPSIVSIIEELLASYTISNDAIGIIWEDDSTAVDNTYIDAESYDATGTNQPILHIEYTESTESSSISPSASLSPSASASPSSSGSSSTSPSSSVSSSNSSSESPSISPSSSDSISPSSSLSPSSSSSASLSPSEGFYIFTDGYGGDVFSADDSLMASGWPTENGGAHPDQSLSGSQRALWRFNLSQIPANSTCVYARLYLYHSYNAEGTAPITCNFYRISAANGDWVAGNNNITLADAGEMCWNAKVADGSGGVTTAWAGSAGMGTSGTDYEADALGSELLDFTTPSGTEFVIDLDPAKIEEWFGLSTNPGIIGWSDDVFGDRHVAQSNNPTTAWRPKLVVAYELAGSPSGSASLSPSSSPSPSVSPSASTSQSNSISPSSSDSASESPSSSQSSSLSPSSSDSASVSQSPSISQSSSGSASVSPSSSLSPSSSQSPSISPSSSLSPSSSESQSVSPSSSTSPSSSGSASTSPSSSISPSSSESPSVSPSPSIGYAYYTRGNYAVLPTDDNDLETLYSAQDITDVETNNEIRVGQDATSEYAVHQFKVFVGASNSCTATLDIRSTLSPQSSAIVFQIYNRNSTTWETIDSNNTGNADTDILFSVYMANLTNYKNASNIVSFRAYQGA